MSKACAIAVALVAAMGASALIAAVQPQPPPAVARGRTTRGTATQQQFAQALAQRLGLAFSPTPQQAVRRLQAAGIAPETGWYPAGPATDVFVALLQKSILDRMRDVGRRTGAPDVVTLELVIQTPGRLSGQTFVVPGPDQRPPPLRPGAPEKLRVGESAKASIESSHPYPIGDSSQPVVWSCRVRHPGAAFVKLHFSRIELAAPDHLLVADRFGRTIWQHNADGVAEDVWAASVDGDTAVVMLVADGQGSAWGFKIDQYGYGLPRASAASRVGLPRASAASRVGGVRR